MVVALDQLTKALVLRTVEPGESIDVIGSLLQLTLVRNTGAAFGLFRGASGLLVLASLAGLGFFGLVIARRPPILTAFAAALIAGGALGNLLVRAFRPWPFRGAVVDFVDFRFWPAFNVADMAVTVGAALLLLGSFTERGDTERHDGRSDNGR